VRTSGGEHVENVFAEAVQEWRDEIREREGIVFQKRGQIDGEAEALAGVDAVGLKKGGIGAAAALDGQIVSFATGNLGREHGVEFVSQLFMATDIEKDFVGVGQPVEIPPALAAQELLRTIFRRELPEG